MSVLDGPGEGTWSVFSMKIVEERDTALEAARIAISQCAQVQNALRDILPLAEMWVERTYDYICDHEPGECTCDIEAEDKEKIRKAKLALGQVAT